MRSDVRDFPVTYRHQGAAAAVGARRAIDLFLDLAGDHLEGLLVDAVRRKIAAKLEVLFGLRGSEPENLGAVGNHVLKILPRLREDKPPNSDAVKE